MVLSKIWIFDFEDWFEDDSRTAWIRVGMSHPSLPATLFRD